MRETVRKMLKENGAPPADGKWADIAVLEPVRDYKARHASTLLTFDAVVDAIGQIESETRRQSRGAIAASHDCTGERSASRHRCRRGACLDRRRRRFQCRRDRDSARRHYHRHPAISAAGAAVARRGARQDRQTAARGRQHALSSRSHLRQHGLRRRADPGARKDARRDECLPRSAPWRGMVDQRFRHQTALSIRPEYFGAGARRRSGAALVRGPHQPARLRHRGDPPAGPKLSPTILHLPCRTTRCGCTISARRIATATSSFISNGARWRFSATCCFTAAFPGSAIAISMA